jgi:hypothetical protein
MEIDAAIVREDPPHLIKRLGSVLECIETGFYE